MVRGPEPPPHSRAYSRGTEIGQHRQLFDVMGTMLSPKFEVTAKMLMAFVSGVK